MLSSNKYFRFLLLGNSEKSQGKLEYVNNYLLNKGQIKKKLADEYKKLGIEYTNEELDTAVEYYFDMYSEFNKSLFEKFNDGDVFVYSRTNDPLGSVVYIARNGKIFKDSDNFKDEVQFSEISNLVKSTYLSSPTDYPNFSKKLFSKKLNEIRLLIAESKMDPIWDD